MSYSYHDDERAGADGQRSNSVWTRGAIMLLFIFCFGLGQSILYAMTVVQFLWLLFKGERNEFIAQFGRSLAEWLHDAARFLTAGTEEKPFPWKPWPPM
jgi:hypothetical protein